MRLFLATIIALFASVAWAQCPDGRCPTLAPARAAATSTVDIEATVIVIECPGRQARQPVECRLLRRSFWRCWRRR